VEEEGHHEQVPQPREVLHPSVHRRRALLPQACMYSAARGSGSCRSGEERGERRFNTHTMPLDDRANASLQVRA
jgi:hypothetical protein